MLCALLCIHLLIIVVVVVKYSTYYKVSTHYYVL